MLKLFNRKKKDNKGFTLVELVIVVAILAILVGLLAPQYTKYVEKSRKSADTANMDEMVRAVQVYAADPANDLKKATYTITIFTTKEVEFKIDGKDADDNQKKIISDTIADFASTRVKSNKWLNGKDGVSGNPVESVTATIVVDKDGNTTVTYSPKSFADAAGKATTTPAAGSENQEETQK